MKKLRNLRSMQKGKIKKCTSDKSGTIIIVGCLDLPYQSSLKMIHNHLG